MKKVLFFIVFLSVTVFGQGTWSEYDSQEGRSPYQISGDSVSLMSYIVYPLNRDGYLKMIDYNHDKLHLGGLFSVSDYDSDVDIATPKQYLIITDSLYLHFTFSVSGSAGTLTQLFESATASDSGSVIMSYNLNRASSDTLLTNFYADPTVSDSGNVIINYLGGTGGNPAMSSSGLTRSNTEVILNKNTIYLLVVTSLSDNNKITFNAEPYEEN